MKIDFFHIFLSCIAILHLYCFGGPGPASFGNDDTELEAGRPFDADHDLLPALDRWVTRGIAPEKIIGTGRRTGGGGGRLTRPLCPYPEVARYKGRGDTNEAENFECAVGRLGIEIHCGWGLSYLSTKTSRKLVHENCLVPETAKNFGARL